jgi:hypothetical protein
LGSFRSAALASALAATLSPPAGACEPARVETSLAGVILGDVPSSTKVVAAPRALPMELARDAQGAEIEHDLVVALFNRDRSERAILRIHPGDLLGSFDEFDVAPADATAQAYRGKTLDVAHLTTERGVALGASEAFVVGTLGRCFIREPAGTQAWVLRYTVGDPRHPLLRRTHEPGYTAHYSFHDGKLVSFDIALDRP